MMRQETVMLLAENTCTGMVSVVSPRLKLNLSRNKNNLIESDRVMRFLTSVFFRETAFPCPIIRTQIKFRSVFNFAELFNEK